MHNNNPYKLLFEIAKDLQIKNNTLFPRLENNELSVIETLRETRTTSFNLGRQSGKTSFIIDNYKDFNDPYVLVADSLYKRPMKKAIFGKHGIENADVFTHEDLIEQLDQGGPAVRKFKNIIVDDFSYLISGWEINSFYSAIADYCQDDTNIILLG